MNKVIKEVKDAFRSSEVKYAALSVVYLPMIYVFVTSTVTSIA